MKKIGLVTLAVFMTMLLSGCGEKKQMLSCTQTPQGVKVEFNVGFKGNVIETMDFNYDVDLNEYTDEQIESIKKQDFCSTIKESFSDYKEAFTNCNHAVESNKHLKVSAELLVDKIAKNALDKMTSVDEAKKSLEAEGYTCVIK